MVFYDTESWKRSRAHQKGIQDRFACEQCMHLTFAALLTRECQAQTKKACTTLRQIECAKWADSRDPVLSKVFDPCKCRAWGLLMRDGELAAAVSLDRNSQTVSLRLETSGFIQGTYRVERLFSHPLQC
jgi:hypothetical protein